MTMTNDENEYARDLAGRFGPGNKGGPGRKPGTKVPSLKSAIIRRIEESYREEDGRSLVDALATVALRLAGEGDFRFWKEIIDRLDGPVKQQIEQDSTVFIERLSRRAKTEDEPETDDDGSIPTD
jgi:hypothetical protein